MNASRRLAALILALACEVVSGVASAQTAQIPADAQPFPPDQKPCLQVVGDAAGSAVLADPVADKTWVEIDREVTRSLVAELARGDYANARASSSSRPRGRLQAVADGAGLAESSRGCCAPHRT